MIARELELRRANGEPNVVLPGEGAEYARRAVERGKKLLAEGKGAARYEGPTEAGVVRPTDPGVARSGAASDALAATGAGR
jgi:hypothetical protein